MLVTRRDFSVALAGLLASGTLGVPVRSLARQTLTQDDLLAFEDIGQVTLLHLTDIHAQLRPLYFREPSVNLGVGEAAGLPPHITGQTYLDHYDLQKGSALMHALSPIDFTSLANDYGKIGGIDRLATLINSIRATRPDKCLLLDGGDTWQGSYTTLRTNGADMVQVMNQLGLEAMTGHWEFTLGQERVQDLVSQLDFPFLAGNIVDTEWEEPVFDSTAWFERGGVKIAVIGQAFPYTPVANPRYMMMDWSFGIREAQVRTHVENARANGAGLIVLLSHNGFDVDRKLASRVEGIDVILTGHTHDALPEILTVGKTLLVGSGSHGKFLSRIDLDIGPDGVRDYRYRLLPVFSDMVTPDPDMQQLVSTIRAPYADYLAEVLGTTENLLYRRGNFNGTFDDLICHALITERDAEIALSPGFRWGASLLPGQPITREDIYNMTAITYPNVYRVAMTGSDLKAILEDVADNLFNPDPYYQQGGDMVRVGGLGFAINPAEKAGQRISQMTLLPTREVPSGEAIDPTRSYMVAGWASVNQGVEGPAVYDLLSSYIQSQKAVSVPPNDHVKIIG